MHYALSGAGVEHSFVDMRIGLPLHTCIIYTLSLLMGVKLT